MQTTAAVMRQLNVPLVVEEIELDPPGPGEVLLRMAAAGICGSDRHVLEGHFPAPLPAVCGHEGSGVVEMVGDNVTDIEVGDHVIQMFIGPCGTCQACRSGRKTFCLLPRNADGTLLDGTFRMHDRQGKDIGTALGLGSFSAHTVTPARNCVVIPKDVDLACAALVSCGVATGVGAALNVGRVRPGDAVIVIGLGGVGAAALLGAIAGGAAQVIAVDVHEGKRAVAAQLGATDFINAAEQDLATALAAVTRQGGADCALLTVDKVLPEHYQAALTSLVPGGIAVQVGSSMSDLHVLPVDPRTFALRQVSFTGTVFGGMDPARDALRWIDLYRAGRLPLEQLITRTYELGGINDAFADLAAGRNTRGVIRYADA